jgi:hypothetical protein
MTDAYNTTIGISVSKGDWDGAQWNIAGYPHLSSKLPQFESAYDFEEVVKEKVNCSGIDFDSEYCMFCAYAKTKQRAIGFAKAIEKYFKKVEETVASSVTW